MFSYMIKISINSIVRNVNNSTVWHVKLNFTEVRVVNSSKSLMNLIATINNLLISSRVLNIKCVLNVNFGSKKIKDVITWLANVKNSFAMFVEVIFQSVFAKNKKYLRLFQQHLFLLTNIFLQISLILYDLFNQITE